MNAHITENNTPAIPAATIARTVVLALALVNQLLSAAGKPVLPIDSASVEQWVTAGLTTAAAIWAWWENNSFTPEAIRADELLDQMQGEEVSYTAALRLSPPRLLIARTMEGTLQHLPAAGWRNRRAI